MQLNQRNVILLAAMAATIFIVTAALLVQVVPGPLKQSDYMVIGAVSTLGALGVVFAVVLRTAGIRDVLFRKRK
jgi:hypothetical protein